MADSKLAANDFFRKYQEQQQQQQQQASSADAMQSIEPQKDAHLSESEHATTANHNDTNDNFNDFSACGNNDTSMTDESRNVRNEDDDNNNMIQANATDDWDTVTRQQDEERSNQFRIGGDSNKTRPEPSAPFAAIWSELRDDGEWKKHLPKLKRVSDNVTVNAGIMTKLWMCCFVPPVKDDKELHRTEEVDFVLCLTQVPLDLSTYRSHQRVLTSVYRRLTNVRGYVALSGSHFEKVGFQGGNPATDLRSTGVFGLVQMLYFLDRHAKIARQSYQESTNPMRPFCWALISLNFTAICVEVLKEQSLNKAINAAMSPDGVIATLGALHGGMFVLFLELWCEQESRSILEFDAFKKQINAKAKKSPQSVIAKFHSAVESSKLVLGEKGKPLEFTEF
eukprot:PhM_4_TR8098/c0_g1_i1/m.22004